MIVNVKTENLSMSFDSDEKKIDVSVDGVKYVSVCFLDEKPEDYLMYEVSCMTCLGNKEMDDCMLAYDFAKGLFEEFCSWDKVEKYLGSLFAGNNFMVEDNRIKPIKCVQKDA